MFITFEGMEGSGKTTQVRHAANFMEARGLECVTTREPGGTRIGKRLRSILLDPENTGISCHAEMLLYMADRAQHIHEVIRPALDRGCSVLCDRYVDAMVAYQGFARGLDVDLLNRLHRELLDDLKPGITFLLDLDPEIGLARAWNQIHSGDRDREETRFEKETLQFHARVRKGYLELAQGEPMRFHVIDAAGTAAEVWNEIKTILEKEL